MKRLAHLSIVLAAWLLATAQSGLPEDFVLRIDGDEGTRIRAIVDIKSGEVTETRTIETQTPAEFRFSGEVLQVLVERKGSGGRIFAVIQNDQRQLAEANGSGPGARLHLWAEQ